MYTQPALVASVNFFTNAVANTDTVTTIVAAPGVGSRIRIVSIFTSIRSDVTGLVWLRGTPYSGNMSPAGGTPPPWNLPEPGYQLPDNTAFTITSRCNVATQSIIVGCYYYIDQVSP